jgi:hypothetical protein
MAAFAATGVVSLLAGFIVMGTATTAQANHGSDHGGSTKWFVCKYTAAPGGTEILQGGNNPVSLSASAINPQNPGGVVAGQYFGDGHDRSYVLVQDTGQPEPPVSQCPASKVEAAASFIPSAECGKVGSFTIPATIGVIYKLDGVVIAPGTYTSPLTGTITAEPEDFRYALTNAPYSLTFDITAEVCNDDDEDSATAAPVVVVQSPRCGVEGTYTIPDVDGVVYLLDDVEIAPGEYSGPVQGGSVASRTITVEPADGFELMNPGYSLVLDIAPAKKCHGTQDATAQPVMVVQSPRCGVQGTYTVPEVDGVVYMLGDAEIAPGEYSGPVQGGSVASRTITVEAAEGFELTNPEYVLVLDIAPAEVCGGGNTGGGGGSTSIAVTPEITYVDQCGTANDQVDGVVKSGYTFVVDKAKGSVTFTAASGYYLTTGPTLTAPLTDVPCPSKVTAVAPTVDQSEDCGVEGSYTIPSTTGVQYLLDGMPVQPGTYEGPVAGTVTAQALGDTVLTDPTFSYALDVAAGGLPGGRSR